jgi:nucleoside 2-deoxyribosyltransferase
MGFDDEDDALWANGIKSGIEAAGWTAVRADKEDHTDRIDDWILNQISKAAFVVADTTENNPGVCFEAGYAQGLGVPVIWTTREDMTKPGSADSEANGDHGQEEDHQLHFDLRQYNHLTWAPGKQADLADDLEQRIRHKVGDGGRTPGMRSPFME